MGERKKYNWRTWPWQVGDRCVVREIHKPEWRGEVFRTEGLNGDEWLKVVPDGQSRDENNAALLHRAECIPLRKVPKPKPREWWMCRDNDSERWIICVVDPRMGEVHYKQVVHVREARK